ncbi:hypothetical protein PHSY_005293 [Pseudozyma hubeiensis SY62]|uniref:Uncharacterized protein n=1 Tax=Pseudozyma hubeiensis (strain SY62) TaxID=1305764 RepID=R9P8L7_PSEHS|nr:hypothetical protein PHSY_005293 [Pseudozyma hubeiensis SY62]GAC97706.1 hypothetical protein PHSY_005293 [Pseudozyma hubeiensis SY62]
MNSSSNNFQNRKAKGLPRITPLKTTGHNSTPSISMNPAAFAANLAALKTKKKIVVCLPAEVPLSDDDSLLDQPTDIPSKNAIDGMCSNARASAMTRSKWRQRLPWSPDQYDRVPCIDMPKDATSTRDIHPEPWPYWLGLPDTIDIYLPGMSAWDEYLEMRYEEQQMEADRGENTLYSPFDPSGLPLPPDTAAVKPEHLGRSLSISTPADPSMVAFKLNRFLQSQQQAQEDVDQLPDREAVPGADDAAKAWGRFPQELPTRLREAFARRRGESTNLEVRPALKHLHTHTMSLGLPSSGGPFGPDVFSALDMIRANSDEGPSKPPSEAQDLPDKPLSDPEAFGVRGDIFLTNITEEDAEDESESELAAERHARAGSWKDLGRGFGYEPDAHNPAHRASFRMHARNTSKFSVSTSRNDDDENDHLDLEGEEAEVRTNPSEDADASDFEEEPDEYGPDHWRARRGSVPLSAFGESRRRYGDEDMSQASDDDSLQDSLTPSDEQFSNPSDEEDAREERMLRRQHRAAERAARRERQQRRRGRANTDNTLPSSSIGEAELHKTGRYAHFEHDDVISNPSDEVLSDIDDSQTFGHDGPPTTAGPGPRFSRDFRFPPSKPSLAVSPSQTRASYTPAVNHPPMSGTLGRASGLSLLNPDAKEFKFGGAGATPRSVSAPVSGEHNSSHVASGHFRLPSIKTSSFGSDLGDLPANAAHLNVGAAPFTPGAFTFKSVKRLQVPELPLTASSCIAASDAGDDVDDRQVENRELQGREKRLRYGPIDYDSQDERYPVYSTSPPRPKASAASIEGPLRSFSSLARKGPPPFLPAGYLQQQRSVSHEARLTADAPSFVPTWAKGAPPFGGSTSFKRPSLPDWNQIADKDVETKALPSILDPAFFALNTGSKAIPIKRPSDISQEGDRSSSHPSTGPFDGSAVVSSAVAALSAGHPSNGALRASGAGQQPAADRHSERAQPVQIPPGPDRHASLSVSLASDTGAGPSGRRDGHGTFSRGSISSMDWRFGRKYRDRNGSKAERDSDDYDREEEEESLTDVVEEIVERLDKALEGWAGKILDEVTIMGQVRPHPRNPAGLSDIVVAQDTIVQEMTSRLEQVLDSRLTPNFFATHARKLTDASDETHSTIRPIRKKPSSTDVKMTSSVMVDTPGELDFDYVQEILEVKLKEFRTNIESSLTEVVEKLERSDESTPRIKHDDGTGEGSNSLVLPSELAEVITSRLMSQLEALLRQQATASEEVQSSSGAELQKAMQSKLDENLFLLSEQGATGRSNIQQMLESEMHTLEQSISKIGGSVEEHLRSALIEYLPPLLQDKVSSDTALADRLTLQLGAAFGPVLSEERRCLLEENQRSRDLLLEALPSSYKIAQSTVELVEPLVRSLKSDPVDSDALVGRLAEVIGKQSIEHLVDLTPVLALLEPLIVKHEEARSFSKKILERQEDTERTLSELPYAINAKTEIFLSSAHDTSERQGLILEKIAEIKAELRSRSTASSNPTAIDIEALHRKLEDLTEDKLLTRETAERTLSELAGVYQVLDSSYEALSRLEAQQDSSEQSHRELLARSERQAKDSADLAKELREAEARAARAEAGQAEAVARLSVSQKEATMLREQLAQMTAELAATKAENGKEREASAKAVAEAVARADRAEAAHVETQHRMNRLLEQANVAEREAYDTAKSVLERASKAEGQVAALEKRISEQDNKIANLQQLSATQKQKAAQSHQKLAEGEKRVKELEGKTEQLAETTARLKVFEERAEELEETRRELQQSVGRERRATQQVGEYEERVNQMERDLAKMKEEFVERSAHEEVKLQLKESQKLVEELEAKLRVGYTSLQTNEGWETVSNGVAWGSMHSPHAQQNGDANRSIRSVSFASTAGGSNGAKREVEVDDGGWWS